MCWFSMKSALCFLYLRGKQWNPNLYQKKAYVIAFERLTTMKTYTTLMAPLLLWGAKKHCIVWVVCVWEETQAEPTLVRDLAYYLLNKRLSVARTIHGRWHEVNDCKDILHQMTRKKYFIVNHSNHLLSFVSQPF